MLMSEVTEILTDMRGGSRKDAMERLVPLVYDELSTLARSQLRHERPDHSLQATALVHEVYLRLLGSDSPSWNDRQHFFRAAAEAMRRILIDHARKRTRQKRGGKRVRVEISGINLAEEQDLDQVLALDEPTIGQDAKQKENLAGMLVDMNKSGRTVIVVTHDVEFVVEHFPRTITMANGQVVSDGPTNSVLSNDQILEECSLTPPQLTLAARALNERFPDISDRLSLLEDVEKAVVKVLGGD